MKRSLRIYCRNVPAVIGAVLLLLIVSVAVLAPVLFPEDPWSMVARPLLPPGVDAAFPLGSDALGRDIAAGLAHGARVSLMIGLVSTTIALVVGLLIGCFAGFYGGWVDQVLMRLTEIFQSTPPFILAIVLIAVVQPSLASITTAIGIVSWPPIARLVRAEFLALRERDFVQAAIGLGMSNSRLLLTQMLPNALSPIIVTASLNVATAILLESGVSFLGLGDPNVMSWGYMVGAGRDVLRVAWFVTAIPGVAILVAVMAINLMGEGLNDALNPRLSRR